MDLISQLNTYMINMGVDYAICGGHAIDLFLGYKTRPHKDLDVAVFWDDRDRIIRKMLDDGWDLYEPIGSAYLHKINSIEEQKRLRANIWCLRPNNQHYKFTEHEKDMYAVDFDGSEQIEFNYVELLFNKHQNGDFLFSRNSDIRMKLDSAIIEVGNLPILAPEVVLLYKSSAANEPDYQLDYSAALPRLSEDQSVWLKKALIIMYPEGHMWIDN